MSSKSRGTNRELLVVRQYRRDGWVAFRAPASLGVADVIALKDGERPQLVEVKSDRKNPYAHFGPDKRLALSHAARRAGAEAWLAWWPGDRGGCRWIAERDWPPFRLSPEALAA